MISNKKPGGNVGLFCLSFDPCFEAEFCFARRSGINLIKCLTGCGQIEFGGAGLHEMRLWSIVFQSLRSTTSLATQEYSLKLPTPRPISSIDTPANPRKMQGFLFGISPGDPFAGFAVLSRRFCHRFHVHLPPSRRPNVEH